LYSPNCGTRYANRCFLIAGAVLIIAMFSVSSFQTVSLGFSRGSVAPKASPARLIRAEPSDSSLYRIPPTGKGTSLTPAKDASTPPPVNWDEQLGLTISQDRVSLEYNVTAVEQSDTYGYGPAYLLNGLTDKGDWFQVGLAYDWPLDNGGYAPGFMFLYESFNSSGASVYPPGGGGGLANYSGIVNEGDSVLLSLNFTGNEVVMYSYDWDTGASAWTNYTSDGGDVFLGLQTSNNGNGYFSGLMTEEYHVDQYLGAEAQEMYTDPYVGLNAGIMWIDEYNPNTNQTLFDGSTADLPYSNPNQLQYYSSNGTTEASDAYEFVTGSNALVGIILSYSIVGGGTNYLPPQLNYTSNGTPLNVTLTTIPTAYFMDKGTTWSVTDPLNGSTSNERWITPVSNGTVSSAATFSLAYTHEFTLSFGVNPVSSGSISPTMPGWYAAGALNLTAVANDPFIFESWSSNSSNIQFSNFNSANTTALVEGSGNITAGFSLFALSLSTYSESLTEGSSVSNVVEITGSAETISVSVTGLPEGATAVLANNQIVDNLNGVFDNLSISTSYSTPAGIYNITVNAAAANGTNSVQFELTVGLADPLTSSYSVSDGSSISSPVLTYVYNGIYNQINLSSSPQVIYVDNGSSWQIINSPNGSSTQRWITENATQGMATGPTTVQIVYYHQYFVGFTFGTSNNSTSVNSSAFPSVTFISGGSQTSVLANGTQVWADSGSPFGYSSVLQISPDDRLVISGNESGNISGTGTQSDAYIQEFFVNASYSISGISSSNVSSPPEITIDGNNSVATFPLSARGNDYWISAGSKWSASENYTGSSTLEKWVGSDTSGIVASSTAIMPDYSPEFLVTVGQNVPSAGLIEAKQGWYLANSSLAISADASQGWKFEMWTGGAGTFNQSSTSIIVNSPVNETAVFYASLSISPASDGHVTYSYGSTSGTVQGGSTTTLYVPPDTSVSMSASSDSSFYSPGQWSIGNSTSSPPSSFTLSVSGPTTVGISFDLDSTLIALIAGVIIAVIGSGVFFLLRRSGGRDFGDSSSHVWKW
jgi:hypothetical protein